MHDCNPQEEVNQIVPKSTARWNGDVWKAFVVFRMATEIGLGLDMCTLDADEGLGVIRLGKPVDPYTHEAFKYPDLTWGNLVKNRQQWLNLKSEEEFMKWYNDRINL